MEGVIKNIIEWTKIKIRVYFSDKLINFRDGEMWWVNLGVNIGHEEDGKNKNFERPVLVLRKFNKYLFLSVALSTKIKDNVYYYKYVYKGNEYSILLSQIRVLSNKRLIRKIGMLPPADYVVVKEKVKNLI